MAVDSPTAAGAAHLSPTADAILLGAFCVLFALAGVVVLIP